MNSREHAQATVFFALMVPVFVALIGLALDGGRMLEKHADLEAVADAASRAGAAALDTSTSGGLRSGASSLPTLNSIGAAEAARADAESQGVIPLGVTADANQVVVRVGKSVPTVFLRVVRLNSLWIEARGVAHP